MLRYGLYMTTDAMVSGINNLVADYITFIWKTLLCKATYSLRKHKFLDSGRSRWEV